MIICGKSLQSLVCFHVFSPWRLKTQQHRPSASAQVAVLLSKYLQIRSIPPKQHVFLSTCCNGAQQNNIFRVALRFWSEMAALEGRREPWTSVPFGSLDDSCEKAIEAKKRHDRQKSYAKQLITSCSGKVEIYAAYLKTLISYVSSLSYK